MQTSEASEVGLMKNTKASVDSMALQTSLHHSAEGGMPSQSTQASIRCPSAAWNVRATMVASRRE